MKKNLPEIIILESDNLFELACELVEDFSNSVPGFEEEESFFVLSSADAIPQVEEKIAYLRYPRGMVGLKVMTAGILAGHLRRRLLIKKPLPRSLQEIMVFEAMKQSISEFSFFSEISLDLASSVTGSIIALKKNHFTPETFRDFTGGKQAERYEGGWERKRTFRKTGEFLKNLSGSADLSCESGSEDGRWRKGRLEDLAIIFSKYEMLKRSRNLLDEEDVLELAIRKLGEKNISFNHVYFSMLDIRSPLEVGLLAAVAMKARRVVIGRESAKIEKVVAGEAFEKKLMEILETQAQVLPLPRRKKIHSREISAVSCGVTFSGKEQPAVAAPEAGTGKSQPGNEYPENTRTVITQRARNSRREVEDFVSFLKKEIYGGKKGRNLFRVALVTGDRFYAYLLAYYLERAGFPCRLNEKKLLIELPTVSFIARLLKNAAMGYYETVLIDFAGQILSVHFSCSQAFLLNGMREKGVVFSELLGRYGLSGQVAPEISGKESYNRNNISLPAVPSISFENCMNEKEKRVISQDSGVPSEEYQSGDMTEGSSRVNIEKAVSAVFRLTGLLAELVSGARRGDRDTMYNVCYKISEIMNENFLENTGDDSGKEFLEGESYSQLLFRKVFQMMEDSGIPCELSYVARLFEIIASSTEVDKNKNSGFHSDVRVSVLRPEAAIYSEWDYIFFPGLTVETFPGFLSEDILLVEKPDLIVPGESFEERLHRARMLFQALKAAARCAWFSVPDYFAGSTTFPSPVFEEEMERSIDKNSAPVIQDSCGSLQEIEKKFTTSIIRAMTLEEVCRRAEKGEVAFLLRQKPEAMELLMAASKANRERASGRPGLWNGVFPKGKPAELLEEKFSYPFAWSASALEEYARCPMKFFFHRVLGLDGLEQFESMPAVADRGKMKHRILERFFSQHFRDIIEGEGMSERVRAALASIASQEVEKTYSGFGYSRACFTGIIEKLTKGLLDEAPGQVPGMLVSFLLRETCFMKALHVRKSLTEYSFEVDLPAKNGALLRFRGFIDRLDIGQSDGIEVQLITDYKSGRLTSDSKSSPILQIPLYILAVEKLQASGKVRCPEKKSSSVRLPLSSQSDEEILSNEMSVTGESRRIIAGRYFSLASGLQVNYFAPLEIELLDPGISQEYAKRKYIQAKRFEAILEEKLEIFSTIVKRCSSGIFHPALDARAFENKCQYCEYRRICYRTERISTWAAVSGIDSNLSWWPYETSGGNGKSGNGRKK